MYSEALPSILIAILRTAPLSISPPQQATKPLSPLTHTRFLASGCISRNVASGLEATSLVDSPLAEEVLPEEEEEVLKTVMAQAGAAASRRRAAVVVTSHHAAEEVQAVAVAVPHQRHRSSIEL